MIKTETNNSIIVQENNIYGENQIVVKSNIYNQLMGLYSQAIEEVKKEIIELQENCEIEHIKTRIKTPESIINKLKKRNCSLTYKNMVNNINDIAGIRIVTKTENDVYKIRDRLEQNTNISILKEKDYIKDPKKSGYSSLHLITEVPIDTKKQRVYVKTEIQIRTAAMDMWSNLEHEIKYKSKSSISKIASLKLVSYAKIINKIEKDMSEMYEEQ